MTSAEHARVGPRRSSSAASQLEPRRFRVSQVGYDNAGFEPPGHRLSVPDLFSAFVGGRAPNEEGWASRTNSIFAEIFLDPDRHVLDYGQEAAPRLENYRNSVTVHPHLKRPSLDQLHEPQGLRGVSSSAPGGEEQEAGGGGQEATKFGWIKGVYIRCLLNIWGVMLFLRMGWMTGQCGMVLAVVIIALSTVVTVITTLSMSAICTNGDVRGGGAYYLISRSLGPEFGGVVGILLFLANAVSGALYILGAGEAIRDILNEFHTGLTEVPSAANDIRVTSILCIFLIMPVTGVGMSFENKTQIVLLVVLLVAMADYFVGALLATSEQQRAQGLLGWSAEIASANVGPDFRGESFFSVFAVFFPSVTGILAGANISGDLKDPCMAIPRGTFLSILTTSVSYAAIVIFLGCTTVRDATGAPFSPNDSAAYFAPNCTGEGCPYGLMNDFQVMKLASAWAPLIYAGIFAACLSSALVSIVSAPRILQALCVDGIVPWLNFFGKGYGADNDPRRGLALTFVISIVFAAIGDLNAVAPITSNFFMAAMGLINFACFHGTYAKSPGFRPGFRYYNLWLSLVGALLCVVIMFVMSWITALVTDVVVVALYVYIAKTCPDINWGSSFQGYVYRNALYYLGKLNKVEEHVKNYRPAILLLSGPACSRPQLVDLAGLLTKGHGLHLCAHITQERLDWRQRRALADLNTRWLHERRVKACYTLLEADTLDKGVRCLLQSAGLGKMRPNILMLGFKEQWQTCDVKETLDYFRVIHGTLDAHLSLCILRVEGGTDYERLFDGRPQRTPAPKGEVKISLETVPEESHPPPPYDEVNEEGKEEQEDEQNLLLLANLFHGKQKKGTIDVWWLYDDGGLTMLLPYILTTRERFKGCRLRVFSVAQDDSVISDEQLNLAALLVKFRIPFTDLSIVSSVGENLNAESKRRFERLVSKFLSRDEKDPAAVTRAALNALKTRTNQFLRLRELLERHSKEANLIVMTLPLPRKEGSTAPLYLAWLDILTGGGLPPVLLVRGNQTSVLTFYS
ncbi:hypothetical protein JTE90_017198 [Oedothorax gibbosus]|uniref:Solute carrier family 12 member 3 n=1 Tax=Oedothorax gibbosus TaxID=931172 RepID=A0AAV6V8N3_9ARAC|nr:hypothetical protein JTE90_017198 [Oedothorax gibbosus]